MLSWAFVNEDVPGGVTRGVPEQGRFGLMAAGAAAMLGAARFRRRLKSPR